MPHLQRRVLFASPLVRLLDVSCRESSSAVSGEERAGAHELIVIRSGVFVKHAATSSRRSLVAEPMHALLLNRDEPFRVSHPGTQGDDCTVLEFSDAAIGEVVGAREPRILDHPETPFRISHAPFVAPLRLQLHRLRSERVVEGAGLAQEECLLGLLGRVVTEGYRAHGRVLKPRREETRRVRQELVERTKHALAVAPSAPWTLSGLAREVGSSPYHLTRVFRASTGLPVHRYLLHLRMSLALEELSGRRGSLSRIALKAGFASHSHFSTAFRRAFGTQPSALAQAGTLHRPPDLTGAGRRPR